MIKEEKINYSIAKKRVKANLDILLSKDHSLKNIFEITFSRPTYTLFNLVKYNTLTEITYGEGKAKVLEFANYFDSVILSDEKYVGLLLENSPEWIYCFYGLLMSGHCPVLLSTKASEEDTIDVLNRLESNVLVTDFNIKSNEKTVVNPSNCDVQNAKEIDKWENEIVFTTSGTSGKAKILSYTGEELTEQIINASGIVKNYPTIASDYNGYLKHLLILPLYHVFGFVAVFLWFSFFNTTFVIPHSLASEHIREACMIAEPSHIFAVPLFWDTVARKITHTVKVKKAEKKFEKGIKASLNIQKMCPNSGSNFVRTKLFASYLDNIFGKSIQFCITGGSHISEETLQIINGIGYPLVNGFGSTEIGISSFASPKPLKTRISESIGKPFDTFEYKFGENDELLVKGKSAYHAMLVDGEWKIRDKGEFISTSDAASTNKGLYFINGRLDEIYIDNNGENYSLPKIEASFSLTFALDLVVLPVKTSKSLAILLSFAPNASDYQINYELTNLVKNPEFIKNKIQEVYVWKHEVPKANGLKIKRNLLTEMLESGNEFEKVDITMLNESTEQVALDSEILNKVIEKFKTITNQDEVKETSDFFLDLGGDSLSYYELIANLEGYFGVKFNFEEGINRTPIQFTLLIMEKM